jgi:hypothetical protein
MWMTSFLAGLFVGEGKPRRSRTSSILSDGSPVQKPREADSWSSPRGVRIVRDGPTFLLSLDAHVAHSGLFTAEDLLLYRTARKPPCPREALNRRKVMRKARSKTKRPILLAELERRYRETPDFSLAVGSLI